LAKGGKIKQETERTSLREKRASFFRLMEAKGAQRESFNIETPRQRKSVWRLGEILRGWDVNQKTGMGQSKIYNAWVVSKKNKLSFERPDLPGGAGIYLIFVRGGKNRTTRGEGKANGVSTGDFVAIAEVVF